MVQYLLVLECDSGFMTLEIIIILLTIVLTVYFLFRPTTKKEKDRFEDKDKWRDSSVKILKIAARRATAPVRTRTIKTITAVKRRT